jgi:AraC-like DNA-binding protein/quercetin dioxygenase-like cupin family protein
MREAEVRIGPTLAAGPFRVREIAYPAGYRQPRHSHPVMGMTLVLGGSIREVSGRRAEYGQPLSVVVKPAGVEHEDEVGPHGARTLQVEFAPAEVAELVDVPGLVAWRWLHGGEPANAMLALLRLARIGGAAGAAAAEDEVLSALGTFGDATRAGGRPPSWLGRVREALDDRTRSTVRELARNAGVHEVSLSRAFRRYYGCTIGEYRRRVRLRVAAATIEGGSEGLSRIAHGSGFADHAHLCRDFRRATGMTPAEFRRIARAGIAPG